MDETGYASVCLKRNVKMEFRRDGDGGGSGAQVEPLRRNVKNENC
jgi:hypothetical protein